MSHDEIVEELARLAETTTHLKNQLDKPKSKLDNFKEYAGVVSLLLSLATGFFAVYTAFFAEPAKSRAEAQGKLHDTLAQIVTLDQEYMHEIQQGDPSANNGALESRRNILLQQAEDLASKSGIASADDQLSLGNSYMFGSRYEPALVHFKAALALTTSDPIAKANAETQLGRLELYGISGSTPQQGRQSFDDAEKLLDKVDSRQSRIALVQSISIRSLVECTVGDPVLGQRARTRAQDKLTLLSNDPAISPQLIDIYRTGLVTGFANSHCSEPLPAATPPRASGAAPSTALPSVSASPNKIELSNEMMRLLVAKDYAGFERNMTATAQAQLPESHLRYIWEQVSAVTGTYQKTLSTKTNVVNNATYYIVHAQCERALVNLALAYDGASRVTFVLLTPLSLSSKIDMEHRALRVATQFFQQDFIGTASNFDANLKAQLTVGQLQSSLMQANSALGKFDHVVGGVKDRDLDFVDVLCKFEGGNLVLRVIFDPDLKISGFVFVPHK